MKISSVLFLAAGLMTIPAIAMNGNGSVGSASVASLVEVSSTRGQLGISTLSPEAVLVSGADLTIFATMTAGAMQRPDPDPIYQYRHANCTLNVPSASNSDRVIKAGTRFRISKHSFVNNSSMVDNTHDKSCGFGSGDGCGLQVIEDSKNEVDLISDKGDEFALVCVENGDELTINQLRSMFRGQIFNISPQNY